MCPCVPRFVFARPVQSDSSHTRRGFTLVELLVVIGIIAILIGILLPSLVTARRAAQLTQCLAIERQIGSGAMMHAQTHLGFYPVAGHFKGIPSNGGVTPESLNDSSRRRYTYQVLDKTIFNGIETTLAPWHAAIALQFSKKTVTDGINNDEIGEDEVGAVRSYLKYFVCPSHNHNAADIPNSMIYYGGGLVWYLQQSYVVNEAVFGVDDAMGRYRGKASRIRRPSQTVMLADGLQSSIREFTMMGGAYNWITFINKTSRPPVTLADALLQNTKAGDKANFDRQRHKGKMNILYFDGHAETRTIETGALRDVYLLSD